MKTVAIVGRPNVGKSTLFNRLIGERSAIVESLPGVTRDRHYGRTEWNGRAFSVVDTGGIVPDSDDVFESAIRVQARLAIEEADAIIFVCDGVDGLVPVDREIAHLLRSSGKRIALVINKCDNHKHDGATTEFHELGLGEPHPISALSGRNTGDFLDEIVSDFPSGAEEEDTRLKLALIGRPNVGKSSITNALLGTERSIVTPVAGTTRDAIDSVLKYYGQEIVLIDTAGLRRRSHVHDAIEMFSILRTARAIERCDVAGVVLDAERGLDTQDKRIISEAVEARKGVMIIVNKWDLVEKETNTADRFTKTIREELKMLDYLPVVYISARTKQRVTKLVELAQKIQERRSFRISTSKLNDALLEDINRVPPPAVRGHDLRINYITQVSTQPPLFAFFCNYPQELPDSYKRYLERCLRRHIDLEGVPVSFVFRNKSRREND